jgi:hypothetical protein
MTPFYNSYDQHPLALLWQYGYGIEIYKKFVEAGVLKDFVLLSSFLDEAAKSQSVFEILIYLLESGANLKSRSNLTALMKAKTLNVAKLLIKFGEQVN